MSEWLVYIILSDDQQLYTGITTNLARRWQQHLSGKGGARYFRGRKPTAIALIETDHNRSSASQREYALKQLKRTEKIQLIKRQQHITEQLLQKLNYLDLPCITHNKSSLFEP
jgi:putative endonuclease